MSEHLRALVVILALASVVFAFAKTLACASAMAAGDFERRRNLWFGITLAAFLAHNFWVYIVASAAILLIWTRRETNKLAMFFSLLFAVPVFEEQITGLGVIDHFFTIHYVRLLALAILLPAYLKIRKQPDSDPFGRSIPDKLLLAFLVLEFLMRLRADTFTNTLRHGVLYAFLDVFLPYYVASRSLKTLARFRDALMAFAVAALVLSAIGAFEYAKRWLLYGALDEALGVPWGNGGFLERAGSLRALASTGQPIILGFALAVGTCFFLYFRKLAPNRTVWGLGLALLAIGLASSISRGPWAGAALMLLVFIATGPSAAQGLMRLALLCVVLVPLFLISPVGQRVIDLLPFVGTVDEVTVTYRERLLQISIQVIMQNPLFGSVDYYSSPLMQELLQGQGIIDIVNSYLGVALSSGLVGLALFLGFFGTVGTGIWRRMKAIADRGNEHHLLGRILLSTLLGILFTIFTVASVFVIPTIYWCVAGLGVAYARMIAKAPAVEPKAHYRPTPMKFRT